MELEEAREFVREHGRAVMLTYRSDGRPQLSPVVTTVDGEGRLMVSTRVTAMKRRNLTRDPRTSLCVLSDEFFGPWVRVDGRAEVVELPDAMELLVEYYRRLRGEHDDWDEYRQAMHDRGKVAIDVTITDWGPIATGGVPPEFAEDA